VEGIYLTAEELHVLSRCSGVAVKAYLRLRARMDLVTGLVGVRSGMSYQALREWTEEAIEKGSGEMLVQPTLRAVRTAVEQLVRRGLLTRARTEKLVFKCVLADLANSRPKRTRHEPGRAKQAEPDTKPDTEPDTNPAGSKPPNASHIRDQSKPSTSQAASTTVSGVDADNVLRLAAALAARGRDDSPMDEETSRKMTQIYECLRGAGVVFNALDRDRLVGWVQQNVTPAQVHAAVQIARQRRTADESRQRITVAYLAAILPDVINPPKSKGPPWWSSDQAMESRARELGIDGARVGEAREQFKARISAAIREQGGVA
jgi:hypothetical protein